jgi:tritrans,polycis-undecaprenyl-diphosphate synthase [geranylgeranyl-diphosphate specific]
VPKTGVLVKHLGLIPDGNRRFARAKGIPAWQGHLEGSRKMKQFISWVFEDWKIPVLTIYGFSAKNFGRSPFEVSKLMEIIEANVRELASNELVRRNKVHLKFIGRTRLLPEKVREAIRDAEEKTAENNKFHLNIALAYDGQAEIADAVASGARTERELEKAMYLGNLPQPDLIIRTSGERRLSGFLLWGSNYAEFAFPQTNWPAFQKKDLSRILADYGRRNRRFGR